MSKQHEMRRKEQIEWIEQAFYRCKVRMAAKMAADIEWATLSINTVFHQLDLFCAMPTADFAEIVAEFSLGSTASEPKKAALREQIRHLEKRRHHQSCLNSNNYYVALRAVLARAQKQPYSLTR